MGDDFKTWAAATAAVVAAVAGVWNLILQMRGRRDCYVVRLGSISPSIDQDTMLHVVSLSEHSIKLTDWGFIEANGSFRSFLMDWETGVLHNEEISSRGSSELSSFGSYFETGYIRQPSPLGAYAISITQKRPRLYFNSNMSYWQRLWIRLRIWLPRHYLSW